MAKLTLGVNNGFAVRNWPEPAEWARLIAVDLGLHHVQFSFDLLDPLLSEPGRSALCAEIRQAAAQYNLALDSTFTGLIVYAQNHLAHPSAHVRGNGLRWFQAAVETTSLLSAGATGGHIGALSLRDQADAARQRFLHAVQLDAVRELTHVAAALGQRYFLWEFMPLAQEYLHTPEQARAALEEVNAGASIPVQLCFDMGHCGPDEQGQAQDPHAWLEELLPWTRVVHLQQTDGKGDRHWPFSPEHAREGIVDPRRVVELARASALAQVDLVFEIGHAFDAPPQQILDDHQRSIECFARWL